jgi:hypothetical protein
MSGWRNHNHSAFNGLPSSALQKRKKGMPWCRRPNGFSDYPKWRAVSTRAGYNLCTVLAFVNRLEELGNDAVNRGDIRGSISGFKAADFAAALDITAEDANKLFATLEHPDIGWIADGMIADFIDRNSDTEDPTSTERKRRERTRTRILRKLGELARLGQISNGERTEIENNLMGLDHQQLVRLLMEFEAKSLQPTVTRDVLLSRRDSVTSSVNPIEIPPNATTEAISVTRDTVTVPVDQNRDFIESQSFSKLTVNCVETVGSAVEVRTVAALADLDSATWLKQEGPQLIMDRLGGTYDQVMARLSRWSGQVSDAVLADILKGAEGLSGHNFHMEVTDQIRRLAA